MTEIIVLGGSGHAKVLISILHKADCRILGYVDPKNYGPVLGASWLGGDEVLPELQRQHPGCKAALGIGHLDIRSDLRHRLHRTLDELGFELPLILSPQSVVNEAVLLGPGTVVFDGAVVNSGSRAGCGCIINTHATVDHDCQLGDNVHIAPGATVCGGVVIGNDCILGTGANIVHGIRITAKCLIGAGATVTRHLTEPGTYVGNPAIRIKGGVE